MKPRLAVNVECGGGACSKAGAPQLSSVVCRRRQCARKLAVRARQQLSGRAKLDKLPVTQHRDKIARKQRPRAVRNDDRRSAMEARAQQASDEGVGGRVGCRSCLVDEQQAMPRTQRRARNGEKLALAGAEVGTTSVHC